MFQIDSSSNDTELVHSFYVETADEVFSVMAENIYEYFKDNWDDYEDDHKEELKPLIKALKSKNYKKLLPLANTFLYDIGNGEGYEVNEIDDITMYKPHMTPQQVVDAVRGITQV